MKEKLIIIGNKQINKDMSFIDDNFDYIFRVNRMLNFFNTGTRIDGLFLGAYWDFRNIYRGGIYRDWYKSAKDIYLTEQIRTNISNKWDQYITKIQWDNAKIFDFKKAKKELGANLTSTICVIWSVLQDPKFTEKYDIWFTGLDVYNRGKLLSTGEYWINTKHKDAGEVESNFLIQCMNEGKLNYLSGEE